MGVRVVVYFESEISANRFGCLLELRAWKIMTPR